ncbi:uncharacterized protein LOC132740768 [Ruditapes philippinarum]|uniref:uncharacterized protein LOC132740768 n=1 Tax=Ruditapes philippinarum TaxID=129788 RepID=UPI00295B9F07|nr:uncharacterized protein LOC132740768 [Ruditapes philippinarum]
MLYNVREEMGYNYISTSFFEDENFFGTLLRMYALTENSDKLMEFYNKENTYNSSLTFPVILAVLDNIETHSAYQYLPQLWEDLAYYVKSKWVDKDLLQKFLDMFGDYNDNQKLREDFVLIAKELFEESKTTRNPAIEFTEIGNRLTRIFVNHKNLDLAWESAMYIYQNGMQGFIKGELLRDVLEMSILEKDVPKIMSFCKLPSEAKDTMAAAQVISDNRNILIECLDDSEMKELEEVFEV